MDRGCTVRHVLEANRGLGLGFDFLRIFLSITIVAYHSVGVSYGLISDEQRATTRVLAPFIPMILPCFFGLSGFLVAGSALRTKSLMTFLSFRGLRLLPALLVEVTLSAILLGPLLTTVAWRDYFTDRNFFAYFGNVVGRIRFYLPGVFGNNPWQSMVNGNLWTLHPELICYAAMSGAIVLGILHRRTLALVGWAVGTVCLQLVNLRTGWFDLGADGLGILFPGPVLVYAFVTGTVAFLWQDKIPVHAGLLFASLVLYIPLSFYHATTFLMVPALIYVTIWIGMQQSLAFPLLKKGDYSYGVYLYGFVLQQTIAALLPSCRHWWIMFPLSTLLAIGFAALSWHNIEKPALRLKRLMNRQAASIPSTTEPIAS